MPLSAYEFFLVPFFWYDVKGRVSESNGRIDFHVVCR